MWGVKFPAKITVSHYKDSAGVGVIDNFPFLSIKSCEMEFENV